jgi:hypothetical protein
LAEEERKQTAAELTDNKKRMAYHNGKPAAMISRQTEEEKDNLRLGERTDFGGQEGEKSIVQHGAASRSFILHLVAIHGQKILHQLSMLCWNDTRLAKKIRQMAFLQLDQKIFPPLYTRCQILC